MAYFKATIDVLVWVDNESEACDCISEALRPILQEFEPASSVIDWRYSPLVDMHGPALHNGAGFEYSAKGA